MTTTDDSTSGPTTDAGTEAAPPAPRRRRAVSRPAGPPAATATEPAVTTPPTIPEPVADTPARPARKRAAKKTAPVAATAPETDASDDAAAQPRPAAKRTRAKKVAPAAEPVPAQRVEPTRLDPVPDPVDAPQLPAEPRRRARKSTAPAFSTTEAVTPAEHEPAAAVPLMFQAPDQTTSAPRRRAKAAAAAQGSSVEETPDADLEETPDADLVVAPDEEEPGAVGAGDDTPEGEGAARRRRRRGGRGRRRPGTGSDAADGGTNGDAGDRHEDASETAGTSAQGGSDVGAATEARSDGASGSGPVDSDDDAEDGDASSRRRRRRRRKGGEDGRDTDDPPNTVTRVRQTKSRRDDEITAVKGSTRLEAKKQRRREGRDAGRRRPSILTEAEFLARREAVDRVMVVRELTDRTQIAVLEDGVLVEHYVNRSTGASMIGNVYLGKVQNVLPSMEAAFVDIGRGRNAVLYAGEVNWDAAGLDGHQPRRIESALKSGDAVLVQVTKDPIGHKGARLTSQISLPGRVLVYVPEGQMNGISRKLADTERTRLKNILRGLVPENAGVIIRTAAEGASEEELARDVDRLAAQWDSITAKAKTASAPALLHGEPDLAIKVVRDIFNEDFQRLVVSGADSWETIEPYVAGIAPDLVARLEKWVGPEEIFHAFRVDEQLTKALDRKVWLPSGGSLVIDRTEAMTVVDVNTGKFTGSGGNLEETVTRNNIEAAEEIVRQLRLRDIGGIIVVDFIDMVLENNRDLVLRRLLECLGRDRTKHQVAEVTSLGLVQMTRKKIGQGLLEVFSEPCEHCNGRGVVVHSEPVESTGERADSKPAARLGGNSASISAGAAKVHAAARRAGGKDKSDQLADSDTADSSTEQQPAAAPAAKRASRSRKKAATSTPADTQEQLHPDVLAAAPAAPELRSQPEPAGTGTAEGETAVAPARTRGGRRRVTRSAGPAVSDGSEGSSTAPQTASTPDRPEVTV